MVKTCGVWGRGKKYSIIKANVASLFSHLFNVYFYCRIESSCVTIQENSRPWNSDKNTIISLYSWAAYLSRIMAGSFIHRGRYTSFTAVLRTYILWCEVKQTAWWIQLINVWLSGKIDQLYGARRLLKVTKVIS